MEMARWSKSLTASRALIGISGSLTKIRLIVNGAREKAQYSRRKTMKIYEVNTKKMHHRHAGDTEVAAAHQVAAKVTGRRLETLRALSTLGGGSGEQISASLRLPITSIRPRLTELQEMELIEDTGRRHKNQYGNGEIIWTVTKSGEQYVY
jgi:hypothetical protein